MKRAAFLLCCALAILFSSPADAGYYRYQDANGDWHYTDDPGTIPSGSAGDTEYVKLPEDQTAEGADQLTPTTQTAAPDTSEPARPALVNPYASATSREEEEARRKSALAARQQAEARNRDARLNQLYQERKKLEEEKKSLDEQKQDVETMGVRKHQNRAGRRYRYQRNQLEKSQADYEQKQTNIENEIKRLEAEKAAAQ
ncbi:MAG: DUF4124 domain-containing protein [Thermodesulfobacteriota bacterium]